HLHLSTHPTPHLLPSFPTRRSSDLTILAVAEGAISKEDAKLSKKKYKEKLANRQYSTVGYELAAQIEAATGQEVRVTIPGHTQRSEEHTSELQSRFDLVCRLLLEKK